MCWIEDASKANIFQQGSWLPLASENPTNAQLFGINATADAVNKLSVSAQATLLNNDGAGHQLKLNKASPTDTSSLLFQTGFSGRAEMGTIGQDTFSVKVSPDGAQFLEAISIDGGSGQVSFPQGTSLVLPQLEVAETSTPFSTASTTYVDIPGLSLSITPQKADSKILVFVAICGTSKDNYTGSVRLMRDGIEVLSGDPSAIADASGGAGHFLELASSLRWSIPTHFNMGVDLPNTNQSVTYSLQVRAGHSDDPVFINQNENQSSNQNFQVVAASRLIVLEVQS